MEQQQKQISWIFLVSAYFCGLAIQQFSTHHRGGVVPLSEFPGSVVPREVSKVSSRVQGMNADRPSCDGFQQQVADILEIFVNATCSTSYVYIYMYIYCIYLYM